jgi:hypothetical protein
VIYRLIYASRSLITPENRTKQHNQIFLTARAHNESIEVTGALYTSTDCFVQALEGDEDVVQALYSEICADPRHDTVELVHQGPADYRVFGDWAMAEVADAGHTDIHYRLDTSGASPQAMLDNPAPDHNIVLTVMRFYLAQAQYKEVVMRLSKTLLDTVKGE